MIKLLVLRRGIPLFESSLDWLGHFGTAFCCFLRAELTFVVQNPVTLETHRDRELSGILVWMVRAAENLVSLVRPRAELTFEVQNSVT